MSRVTSLKMFIPVICMHGRDCGDTKHKKGKNEKNEKERKTNSFQTPPIQNMLATWAQFLLQHSILKFRNTIVTLCRRSIWTNKKFLSCTFIDENKIIKKKLHAQNKQLAKLNYNHFKEILPPQQ